MDKLIEEGVLCCACGVLLEDMKDGDNIKDGPGYPRYCINCGTEAGVDDSLIDTEYAEVMVKCAYCGAWTYKPTPEDDGCCWNCGNTN